MSDSTQDLKAETLMTAEKLLKIHSDLEALGIGIILDGGWGTDALLREQTRPHRDADFFIEKKDLEAVRRYFFANGFTVSDEEGQTGWHFLLESKDAIVDIHVIEFDETGSGTYGPKEHNAIFPSYAFEGEGEVNGVKVRCISPKYRVECLTVAYGIVTRTGFQMKDTDYEDISAICKKFNIELPIDFVEYGKKHGKL